MYYEWQESPATGAGLISGIPGAVQSFSRHSSGQDKERERANGCNVAAPSRCFAFQLEQGRPEDG